MSAGVKFSIWAAQVRMGVWLQVNCKVGEDIRVTKKGRGYKGHAHAPYTPGAQVLTEGGQEVGGSQGREDWS